jgi:hypothetical protein
MKFNKWTYGLAAVGVVSLASAARADEAKPSAVETALSNTTISGSVSFSAQVALDPNAAAYANSVAGSSNPFGGIPFQRGKQDGFNLDVVRLTIAKPQDESPWASGYQIDLMFGPDAVGYNPSNVGSSSSSSSFGSGSDFAIKQAYVALRTPVGNGIDWKFGVFDTVVGYEVTDAGNNPNYTRSFGYAVEPTEHTGVLATYKINDMFTVSAGVANTLTAGINFRNTSNNGPSSYWKKTFMGSVAMTAPSSWGWAAGSTMYAGVVYGFNNAATSDGDGEVAGFAAGDQLNGYFGATLNTPIKALTVGAAFDYVQNLGGGSSDDGYNNHNDVYVVGLYATYKATDKLSLSARGEYLHVENISAYSGGEFSAYSYSYSGDAYELTGTIEYDLWANVISRVEVRWDHFAQGTSAAGFGNDRNFNRSALGLYANIIYKF